MQSSQLPTKIQVPFAQNAGGSYIRTVPVASQIGISAGAASFNDGFVPLNCIPDAAGGINPDVRDVNGVLNALSALLWWYSAGGSVTYDAAFQTVIVGYPKGAILQSAAVSGILWISTTENNVTNPDTGGAGWQPAVPFTGLSSITMTGSNVTATLAQYGVRIISITGALTANLNLILPNFVGTWTIVNNATGAYTITAKTVAGTGVVVTQGGSTDVSCDGTNIFSNIKATAEIGIGQTWQTGTASTGTPAWNTPYQNTSTKPIMVSVWGASGGGFGLEAYIDISSTPTDLVAVGGNYNGAGGCTFIVQPNYWYKGVSGGKPVSVNWKELR